MSVRSAVALHQGADEEFLASAAVAPADAHELSAVHRAALRLADTYLTHPAGMTDADRQAVSGELTAPQIVELVVKLMTYSSDKVMVALGFDLEEPGHFVID